MNIVKLFGVEIPETYDLMSKIKLILESKDNKD
jgi:hypothetical protein